MTEELRLIVELFAKVTNGALIGGIAYLVLQFLQATIPWAAGTYLGAKLINRLTITKKPVGDSNVETK